MAGSTDSPLHVIRLDRAAAIRVSGYGVILIFLALQISDAATSAGNADPSAIEIGGLLLFIATMFVTVVLHELVHGVFFALFGPTRPHFGVGVAGGFLPYAYASAPGQRFSLLEFTAIGLAPFVLLSIVSLAIAVAFPSTTPIATAAFITNFTGACGDLWIVSQTWRFRGSDDLRFVDMRDAVAVYATGERAQATAARMSGTHSSQWSRFLSAAFLASMVAFLVALLIPFVLLILDVRGEFTIGPEAFPLISFSRGEEGAAVTFGLLPALIAGVAFAALYTTLPRLRRGR